MGNILTTSPETRNTAKYAIEEDKILVDKVIKKARELYNENKTQFLDPEFCEKISIIYSKKLYQLPLEKVKTIYDKIEAEKQNDLELTITYDPLNEERFLVNELSGRIVDYFKDKDAIQSADYKGVKLTFPKIAYIQNRALLLLNNIQKIEQKKLQGGKPFNNTNYNNNENNENNNNYNNENNNENENENENNFEEEKKFERRKNQPIKSEFYEEAQKKLQEIKAFTKKENKNIQKNTEKTFNNISFFSNKPIIPSEVPAQNVKPVPAERPPIVKPVQEQPVRPPIVKPVQEQPVRPPIVKPVQEQPTFEKKDIRNVQKVRIEEISDKYCVDEKFPCKLTKKEMCDKIVYHFVVRNNLIAAIVSTIPTPNESGEYSGSFTYDRLKSLDKGVFCLPPYYSDIQDQDDNIRIQKILRFLNIMDEKECITSGGFLLRLSPERYKELLADDKLGQKYMDFIRKINIVYQESLMNLYNILEELQNNKTMSTSFLNELSRKTKQIIEELFIKTQFNYLLAVLIILDFDFIKSKEALESKKKRIDKIIKEDFGNN